MSGQANNETVLSSNGVDRLRELLIRAYTRHTETRGGIVRHKTAKQIEIETVVARELVAFSVDYGVVQGFMSPDALWLALLDDAIERGDLVRTDSSTGQLQHRLDYQLGSLKETDGTQ